MECFLLLIWEPQRNVECGRRYKYASLLEANSEPSSTQPPKRVISLDERDGIAGKISDDRKG